jgi:hypothetical protein
VIVGSFARKGAGVEEIEFQVVEPPFLPCRPDQAFDVLEHTRVAEVESARPGVPDEAGIRRSPARAAQHPLRVVAQNSRPGFGDEGGQPQPRLEARTADPPLRGHEPISEAGVRFKPVADLGLETVVDLDQ